MNMSIMRKLFHYMTDGISEYNMGRVKNTYFYATCNKQKIIERI